MSPFFADLRTLHILSGAVALFVAPAAMATLKGGIWHRRWGKIYFWAMVSVALTALALAWMRVNLFLLLTAIFSFYMSFSGYRSLYRKRPTEGQGAAGLDWIVASLTGISSTALAIYGIKGLIQGNSFSTVALVFGIVGLALALHDIRDFVSPPKDPRAWLYSHMTGFLGAYIATLSAFSAVNMMFLPILVRWLWPTAIGVPFIFYWVGSYSRRTSKRAIADFRQAH